MRTGSSWRRRIGTTVLAVAVLCAGSLPLAAASQQGQKKTKKQQPPTVTLPSGPTGIPVPQIPLDAQPAVPPQVSYQNNELTIVAANSTLADILRAVRKQTGAEIEIPAAPDRVVTHLGPGPARDVVAELLNGSRFNYILLGSPGDDAALTRVVLVAKTGPQDIAPPASTQDPSLGQQPVVNNAQQAEQMQDNDADAADDNADDNADQPAQADQQQPSQPDQNQVKTPQQMLQEMQQRQMQLQQQQQQPGQPPVPPAGRPPGAPQQQQ